MKQKKRRRAYKSRSAANTAFMVVDYTPSHIRTEKVSNCKKYMAHHQGMSMGAINNPLNDRHLVRRFMAITCMRASELC